MQPRQFTIYAIDAQNSVLETDRFEAADLFAAHAHARTYVRHNVSVELWEGSVCVLRMRRGT